MMSSPLTVKLNIISIFKSVDEEQFSNYRPVSLLPFVSRLFEHLMYNRISSFIHKHNKLVSFQYGFRKDHSTNIATVILVDKLDTALDNKLSAIRIFIDLQRYLIPLVTIFWKTNYSPRGMHIWIERDLKSRVQHYIGMFP